MAHFIGSVQGNRGGASRLGSKKSGMDASASGWDIGAKIWAYVHTPETVKGEKIGIETDAVRIDIDGGSSGASYAQTIADAVEVRDADGKLEGVEITLYGEDRKEIAKFLLPR